MEEYKASYSTEKFNYASAKEKQLVAVTGEQSNIIGTAIPQYDGGRFTVTIEGEKYIFDTGGNPVSQNAKDGKLALMMATSEVNPNGSGTIGETPTALTRSVNEQGIVSYQEATGTGNFNIVIDNLNARDQFAIQVLRGILDKIPHPDELGQNEITHYCESAYNWAGYLMKMSGETRNIIQDQDTSDNAHSEEIGYLDTNTEKLLNNIVAALDKTNAKIITEGVEHTAERVTIPEVNTKLDTLIASANAIKTSLDTHTTALNSIKTSLDAQTTALNAIATAIGNLELSPVINNNITIPPTPTEE